MALFAQIDENNVVLRVVVVDDANAPTEEAGVQWCVDFFGGGIWKQTWVDGGKRKNYAGIDSVYNPILDIFLVPKPLPSHVINAAGDNWEPPVPYPADGGDYVWFEDGLKWVPACPYPPDRYYYWDDASQIWKAFE